MSMVRGCDVEGRPGEEEMEMRLDIELDATSGDDSSLIRFGGRGLSSDIVVGGRTNAMGERGMKAPWT